MPSRAHSASDEGPMLIVADGAEHADRERRPEQAQVDGQVEARPAGAQRSPARSSPDGRARDRRRSPCARSTTTDPAHSTPVRARGGLIPPAARGRVTSRSASSVRCGGDLGLGERLVVGAHGVGRAQLAAQHRPHQPDQVQLRLRALDLAPEQRDPRAVPLRPLQQLERVAGGAGRRRRGCRRRPTGRARPARPARPPRCRPSSGTAGAARWSPRPASRTIESLTNPPTSPARDPTARWG